MRFYEQPTDGRILLADHGKVVATITPDGTLATDVPLGVHALADELVLVPRSVVETADRLLADATNSLPHMATTITGTRCALAPYLRDAA